MKPRTKQGKHRGLPKFLLILLCSITAIFIISLLIAGKIHLVVVQFRDHEEGAYDLGDDIFNYFPIQVHTNDDIPNENDKAIVTTSEELLPLLFKKTKGSNDDVDEESNWNVLAYPDFEFTLVNMKQFTEEERNNIRWANFTSTTNETRPMAIHPHFDYISRAINRQHHWVDCDILPELWNELTQEDASNNSNGKPKIYVEIGANIGSCVMEMLLSTNALIVAFEPHPKNQLCLLQTISKLEPELQKRIIVVPIALGDSEGLSTIYSASNNMGNSVVGQVVKDYDTQTFDEDKQYTIQIERLDSVFKNDDIQDKIDIPLLKLDAQGYECRILEGMGVSIASSIKQVKFEYAKKWINAQNCTDLLPRLRQFGYDIYRGSNPIMNDESFKAGLVDLIAKKNNPDE